MGQAQGETKAPGQEGCSEMYCSGAADRKFRMGQKQNKKSKIINDLLTEKNERI